MTLNSVVLPAPFGPITPTTSPLASDSDTDSSAVSPPKATVTSWTARPSASVSVPPGRRGCCQLGGSAAARPALTLRTLACRDEDRRPALPSALPENPSGGIWQPKGQSTLSPGA